MANQEIEDFAIGVVMRLEREARREPEDVRGPRARWDVTSPPRHIEVNAFGGSARGAPVPLEQRQVDAAQEDSSAFYLYVVDNVALAIAGAGQVGVRVIPGETVLAMIERTKPSTTYWPTLRVGEYDAAERLPSS